MYARRAAPAAVLLALTGCGQPAAAPTPTPVPRLSAPAIIQVENSPAGRPQSGLAAAAIVYEYVAEGGIGRFSLLFFGSPPPSQSVGPVRSVRTVTVALAGIYQGFVVYSGASTYISGLLSRASFPSFNEDKAGGNLFRISSRAPPHNLYTDGRHIASLAASAALTPVNYQLWPRTAHPAGGVPATRFTAPVSFFERPQFTWRADRGGFTRTEDTGLMLDPVTGQPLILPTVVVEQVAVTTDSNVVDVDGQLGVDHQVTGSGKAQVFTGGREYQATWTQPAHGPPQFALPDGSPAPIAPGEVWISLVPTGQPAVVG